MPRGSRPGERRGGRQKGTPNKRTAALRLAIEKVGMTPLEFMLSVMAAKIPEEASPAEKMHMLAVKLDAAKNAAPYCHARRGSETDDPMSKSEKAEQLRKAAAEMREKTNICTPRTTK